MNEIPELKVNVGQSCEIFQWKKGSHFFLSFCLCISVQVSGKLPPKKLTPRKLPTRKLPPMSIPSMKSPSPLINHTNERKSKTINFFALKKAVQHNILIKLTKVLFDTQMIWQKILGLNTFFKEWKKSDYWTKAKISKRYLLASCTRRGELKLGTQTIKFGKYVKLLNSQLSLHITLWI